MGSEIRSNEDISNLCGFASGYLKLLEKENFVKIFPELGLPKRKVGLHEQITVEKRLLHRTQTFFFFANYTGTMPTILFGVNEWDFPQQGRCYLSPN